MCLAVDKKQASVVHDYVRRILELPAFRSMVIRETADEIELSNNMVIAIHACSYRSLRGFQICAVVLDELAFFRVEGANPSREILTALRPSLGNIKGSLMLAISSTYSRSGPLWDVHRNKYGKNDAECLVWRADTISMNPTYSQGVIQRALKEDYSAARAEFFSDFRADLETFLPTELVEAAMISDRFALPPIRSFNYFAFTDPSSGLGDAMTLSICHTDGSKIIQDCLVVKHAPFDPGTAVREFSKVLHDYGIATVEGDRYAIGWTAGAFEKEGIFYDQSPQPKSDIFLESLALFMQGRVELLDNPEQANELRQLERRTGKQKDTVDHPKGLYDDCANALCGSLVMASRSEGVRTPGPSFGISEPLESEQEKMARESRNWLLGSERRKTKKQKTEIDLEQLEAELMNGLEDEVDARKDTKDDIKFFRGW